MTAPQLLALAHGIASVGEHRCFYCGAPCGEEHPAAEHVKSSFTGRSVVVAPGSPWVCPGCVLCLRESAEITLIDGEIRRGQMMRGYSWVLTRDYALAATKAHLGRLRTLCLDPPEPPFAIVLSDSGQTHQLYRGVINHARDVVTVTLEGEPITYRPGRRPLYQPDELSPRLDLCGRLVAATGKPALWEPITARFAMAVMGRYRDGEALISLWDRVREQPLSRLAAWLCGNKDLCQQEYPGDVEQHEQIRGAGHGGVPPKTRGSGGPRPDSGGVGKAGNPRDRHPTLFGPGGPVRGEP